MRKSKHHFYLRDISVRVENLCSKQSSREEAHILQQNIIPRIEQATYGWEVYSNADYLVDSQNSLWARRFRLWIIHLWVVALMQLRTKPVQNKNMWAWKLKGARKSPARHCLRYLTYMHRLPHIAEVLVDMYCGKSFWSWHRHFLIIYSFSTAVGMCNTTERNLASCSSFQRFLLFLALMIRIIIRLHTFTIVLVMTQLFRSLLYNLCWVSHGLNPKQADLKHIFVLQWMMKATFLRIMFGTTTPNQCILKLL